MKDCPSKQDVEYEGREAEILTYLISAFSPLGFFSLRENRLKAPRLHIFLGGFT